MIFNYSYGGISQITITINGAPGETITLSPTKTNLEERTLILNSNGTNQITLSRDTYTLVGSISKNAIQSQTFKLEDGKAYNMWGDCKVLYWYGKQEVGWTLNKSISSYDSGYIIEQKDNIPYYINGYFQKLVNGSSSYAGSHFYGTTSNLIDTSQYESIKFDYYGKPASVPQATDYVSLGYNTTQTYNLTGNKYTSTQNRGIYTIASPKSSVYIGFGAVCDLNGYKANNYCDCKLYACWLQ